MKSVLKRILLSLPGLEAACRRSTRYQVRVLRYGHFTVQENVPGRITLKSLQRQMKLVASYHSLWNPNQHVSYLASGKFSGYCPVIVTVDGGYQDLIDIAYPVWRNHGVRLTVFMATEVLEKLQQPASEKTPTEKQVSDPVDGLHPVTAEQLRRMAEAGIPLGVLSPPASKSSPNRSGSWHQKITTSWQDLKQLVPDPLQIFAYQPGGQDEIFSENYDTVRECGFRLAYLATHSVPDPQDRFSLPRYSPTEDHTDFRWHLCGAAALLNRWQERRQGKETVEPPIYTTMRRWIGKAAEAPDYHPGRVGVVVTCYNYGRYLAGCIESIQAQTYSDFEVVIVDDGSTDDTPLVAEQWSDDTRIRYVRQANQGQAAAKNRGIRECRTEFVAFLDADDRWEPTKLAKQVALFADPRVGVVYSLSRRIDESGAALPDPVRSSYFNARRGQILRYLIFDNFVRFSATVVRRNCLEETGGFKEYLPMAIDWDLWLRIAARDWHFDFVDEPLFQYRIGHGDQMSRKIGVRHRCSDQIMREFRRDYPAAVSRRDLNRAQSYSYQLRGGYYEQRNRFLALWLYAKSAVTYPWQTEAYRGIVLTLLPFLKPLKDAVIGQKSRQPPR